MKPRDGEKIGGGFFVFRRGKRTGRVACGALPPVPERNDR